MEPRAKCWLSDFTMMSSAWWAFLISALQRKPYGLLHPEPFGDFYAAFKLWCWRKLLRVPWTARRSISLISQSERKTISLRDSGKQPWIFIGRTDAKVEVTMFWPPDAKGQLTGKDSDDGQDWGQEEKGPTEGEMVGWHQWLSGHEFEPTLGDRERQKTGVLQSMGSQKVRHNWMTEQYASYLPVFKLKKEISIALFRQE